MEQSEFDQVPQNQQANLNQPSSADLGSSNLEGGLISSQPQNKSRKYIYYIFVGIILISLVLWYNAGTRKIERLQSYLKIAGDAALNHETDKALANLDKIIEENPPNKVKAPTYLMYAWIYTDPDSPKKDYIKASEYCGKATNLDPELKSSEVYEICQALEKR